MTTIKLNLNDIKEQIKKGNNCNGSRVLAVAPDGSDHRIHWMENNRQWNPWPDAWLIIGIPALFPDGEGAELEMAEECLRDNLPSEDEPHDADYIMEKLHQADVSVVTYAHDHFPNYMQAAEEDAVAFWADAFLAACNGDGTELEDPAPWGYEYDDESSQGPIAGRQPPAEFEWA